MAEISNVESRIEQLATVAAERAAELALRDADRTQKLAVERAVKDANVERDLREHGAHLDQINGSQHEMASTLVRLERAVSDLAATFDVQVKIQEALAKAVQKQGGLRLSRKALIISALGVIAAYCTLVVLVVINVH